MSLQREQRIAVVSDIHLGHERTPTAKIIENLNRHLNNDEFLKTIDVLFFAGDVYDRLLALASLDATLSDQFASDVLRRAQRNNVKIRLLEGTPSHERKQLIRFVENNEKNIHAGLPGVDLKYFDQIDIEIMEDTGLSVLYIPDEISPTTAKTLERVRELMAEKDLTQVDLAIMHGFFPHQLGNIPEQAHAVHDPQAYLGLVRQLIFIGHVHTSSVYERIHAQGSFDRLGHNEEEPKGFFRAVLMPSGDYTVEFIENVGAMRYVTVVCDEDEVTEAILKLDKVVAQLPVYSHVRVQAKPGHPILTNERVLRERHRAIYWTLQAKDREKKRSPVLIDRQLKYEPIVLEPGTIDSVLHEYMLKKKHPADVIAAVGKLLQGLKQR